MNAEDKKEDFIKDLNDNISMILENLHFAQKRILSIIVSINFPMFKVNKN